MGLGESRSLWGWLGRRGAPSFALSEAGKTFLLHLLAINTKDSLRLWGRGARNFWDFWLWRRSRSREVRVHGVMLSALKGHGNRSPEIFIAVIIRCMINSLRICIRPDNRLGLWENLFEI
jgi:hypothetical protein